ncbi:MAG TPA: hypothetical protein VHZ02_09645, partial [Acidimicrobiales bacterium]|nr:hypothetical protein [Acidimicrobiales bacterium]
MTATDPRPERTGAPVGADPRTEAMAVADPSTEAMAVADPSMEAMLSELAILRSIGEPASNGEISPVASSRPALRRRILGT